jgi:hypothetical protein
MTADLYLVIGVILVAFTIPAIISAFSESRPPRTAAVLVLIGGGLIVLAVYQTPGGYRIEDIPEVFVRVAGRYLN